MCWTRGSARIVAVFHAGLAPKKPRLQKILPDIFADHRLRHSVFLGRAMIILEFTSRRKFPSVQSIYTLVAHGQREKMSKSKGIRT